MWRMHLRVAIAAGLLSAAALATLSATAARAAPQEYGWCAVYRGGSENCGFASHAQCADTVSGTGGFCRLNGLAGNGQGRRAR